MTAVPPAPTFIVCWIVLGLLWPAPADAQTLRYLGQQIVPHAHKYAGTTVGGLSGLDFDPASGQFVALSDDRSKHQSARFYTLTLDPARFERAADPGFDGVHFLAVTMLVDSGGRPYAEGEVDPEAIRFGIVPGRIVWTSEGDARRAIPPTIVESGLDGRARRNWPISAHVLPEEGRGVRNNLAFESLAIDRATGRAYVGLENALHQDGPTADLGRGSPARIFVYDAATGNRLAEHVYEVDPVPVAPALPLMFRTNGLVELLAAEGGLLALERSFALGAGNGARLYRVDLDEATDVSGIDALEGVAYRPARKTLLLDFSELGVKIDNLEGMSWGPLSPNGRRTLIFVADDNFSARQITQFLAFEWED